MDTDDSLELSFQSPSPLHFGLNGNRLIIESCFDEISAADTPKSAQHSFTDNVSAFHRTEVTSVFDNNNTEKTIKLSEGGSDVNTSPTFHMPVKYKKNDRCAQKIDFSAQWLNVDNSDGTQTVKVSPPRMVPLRDSQTVYDSASNKTNEYISDNSFEKERATSPVFHLRRRQKKRGPCSRPSSENVKCAKTNPHSIELNVVEPILENALLQNNKELKPIQADLEKKETTPLILPSNLDIGVSKAGSDTNDNPLYTFERSHGLHVTVDKSNSHSYKNRGTFGKSKKKTFYNDTSRDLIPINTGDDILQCHALAEKADVDFPAKNLRNSHSKKLLIPFSAIINSGTLTSNSTKRKASYDAIEKISYEKLKMPKLESSAWTSKNQYLQNSQAVLSDTQMFNVLDEIEYTMPPIIEKFGSQPDKFKKPATCNRFDNRCGKMGNIVKTPKINNSPFGHNDSFARTKDDENLTANVASDFGLPMSFTIPRAVRERLITPDETLILEQLGIKLNCNKPVADVFNNGTCAEKVAKKSFNDDQSALKSIANAADVSPLKVNIVACDSSELATVAACNTRFEKEAPTDEPSVDDSLINCFKFQENKDQVKHVVEVPSNMFAAGNGKQITLSKDAIHLVKNQENCEDDDGNSALLKPSGNIPAIGGRNAVIVSEKSLKFGTRPHGCQFSDVEGIDDASGGCVALPKNVEQLLEENSIPKHELTTGTGKPLSFSKDPINFVKDISPTLKKPADNSDQVYNNLVFGDLARCFQTKDATLGGFSTGSGKTYNISEDKMKAALGRFSDIGYDDIENLQEEEIKCKSMPKRSGLRSQVREKSLRCVTTEPHSEEVHGNEPLREKELKLDGFSTANGKRFNVSDSFRENAKSNVRFKAGTGKYVSISEDAINWDNDMNTMSKKHDEKYYELVNNNITLGELARNVHPNDAAFGFCTGKGKNLTISGKKFNAALAKFSGVEYDKIENLKDDEVISKPSPQPNGRKQARGFTTGSGKFIAVSEKSMNFVKTKVCLDDDDISDSHIENANKDPPEAYKRPKKMHELELSTKRSLPIKKGTRMDVSEITNEDTSLSLKFENNTSVPSADANATKDNDDSYSALLDDTDWEEPIVPNWLSSPQNSIAYESSTKSSFNFGGDQSIFRQKRQAAREAQARRKGERVSPMRGSLLQKKTCGHKFSWRQVLPEGPTRGSYEKFCIKNFVFSINFENSADFRFFGPDFYSFSDCELNANGFPVGDGNLLIFDDTHHAGWEEFERAFVAGPGVDTKLLPEGWVRNHYQLIVWKLACYEISCPQHFAGRGITPHNVMLQLKYRYDLEIDRRSKGSALKRIFERDDSSAKPLVLCVVKITKGVGGYSFRLTDGWYVCEARADAALNPAVEAGKLQIGTKIMSLGADLIGCEEGAPPLEIPSGAYLKLSTNSTRRVRWYTKLGFQNLHSAPAILLKSVAPGGGPICRVNVHVLRVYPVVHVEKTEDGRSITRNGRTEQKKAAEFQQQQEFLMQQMLSQFQKEETTKISTRKKYSLRSRLDRETVSRIKCPKELCEIMENAPDPSQFEKLLSDQQLSSISSYQDSRKASEDQVLQERMQAAKMPRRNVSDVLRAKVRGVLPDDDRVAVLSWWNPAEDVIQWFTEGKALTLYNVKPGNSQHQLYLNSTRQSKMDILPLPTDVRLFPRKVTQICDISPNFTPTYDELDVVGLVVYVHQIQSGQGKMETVYLTDSGESFFGLTFWRGLEEFSYEKVLTEGSVVCASNIQWRKASSTCAIPCGFFTETSVVSSNPKSSELREALDGLKLELEEEDIPSLIAKSQDAITLRLQKMQLKRKLNTSYEAFPSPESSVISNRSDEPTVSSPRPQYLNALLPQAESTPVRTPLKRRMQRLEEYGQLPPITTLPIVNSTAFAKFRKPIVFDSPPMEL